MPTKSVSNENGGSSDSREIETRRVAKGRDGESADVQSHEFQQFAVSGKFRDGPAMDSVIQGDQRRRILETHLPPWRRICALRAFSGNYLRMYGTGWLAGPRTIVTAGHVLFLPSLGGWASSIEVSPARNGNEFPIQPFIVRGAGRFEVRGEWFHATDPDFDIGCIHLPIAIGDRLGWFDFGVVPPQDLENHLINISGYPTTPGAGTYLYHGSDRIVYVSNRRLFYETDTSAGQSGAPAWILESSSSDVNSRPLIIGIHAYDTSRTPAGIGLANSAPRIDQDIFQEIEQWVARSI